MVCTSSRLPFALREQGLEQVYLPFSISMVCSSTARSSSRLDEYVRVEGCVDLRAGFKAVRPNRWTLRLAAARWRGDRPGCSTHRAQYGLLTSGTYLESEIPVECKLHSFVKPYWALWAGPLGRDP